MINDYNSAKKLGEDAVRAAHRRGQSPYLPVLNSFEEVKTSLGEERLGLLELPLSRITGNKEVGRTNAFANNFMPIFPANTEFAVKWSDLYDSYIKEGIRDAIKCYEYMNHYYVQEGNKRVSVSKYGGSEYILADVIRILPERNDTKEVKAYYEYLDFYKVTKNYYIVLSEPGEYAKLAELLGQDLENPWPEDLCSDLKSAFFRFSKKFNSLYKGMDDFVTSEAFLVYISIFPMKTIFEEGDAQIISNIKLAKDELFTSADVENIAFVEEASKNEAKKQSVLSSLFSNTKKYTASSPLRVGFIYDKPIEESRWIDSHEAGRLYVDEIMDDNVVTKCYISKSADGSVNDALSEAISDKNEIIFTVSDDMMSDTLKAAVKNPKVKFLNCSVGNTSSSVRCYQGKFYEASFLMGILTADIMLREGLGAAGSAGGIGNAGDAGDNGSAGSEAAGATRKIGYLARSNSNMSIANLNAFAVGVSFIDPECRISLKYIGDGNDCDYRKEWEDEGVKVFADFEYSYTPGDTNRPGVYKVENDKDVFIGTPYFSWGKYYVQIVQSVLCGSWNLSEIINNRVAANYWFGLSTGVVDVRAMKQSYQTKKLISFFKNAIIGGGIDPFSGELRSTTGVVMESTEDSKSGFSATLESLTQGQIASMNWLNENIDGSLPIAD
ncbi:MAG: BMP family ABC transporter substrate-binding protein [Lachnospiraceae bacterium]|nr:BMP family ABC transporter substrate-binding protein [Lachnospiraceae bacterium]